jgi:Domain of unknown function (DUF5668)
MTDTPTGSTDPAPTTETATPTPTPPPTADAAPGPAPAPTPPYDPTGWQPTPRAAWARNDQGRWATIVFGVVLLVVGLWFFADQTLGLEMPQLRWSQLWPVFLIGLGVWIALGSMRRSR